MPRKPRNMRRSGHATGGGSATQAGTDYQNRVAAWAAVSILAEHGATLPFDLPANLIFEFLRCETEQPVDDIMIGTSNNGLILIQAKHTMTLQKGQDSELASTIKQFVQQFMVCRNMSAGRPCGRPLDLTIDRLVLATGIGSSRQIRENLKSVLNRVRTLVPGQSLEDAATNNAEKEALSVVTDHISFAWLDEYDVKPSNDEIRSLLSLIWVVILDVDPEGSAETEAKNLLRSTVLQNPTETNAAWSILIQACANFARSRGAGGRRSLQQILLSNGIELKAVPSYLEDIQRLRQCSKATVEQLADLSIIHVGRTEVKIKRKSTLALRSAVEKESILVVGEPGAGKSGALHDIARELLSDQFDVVFIAVDRIEAQSFGTLRNELGISHEFIDVLENWPGLKPAFLVIDALDAARSETAIRTFRSLISAVIKLNSRWKIVVSMRKFDLRYNKQLQEMFLGAPPTVFQDSEFNHVHHINIPTLDDEELNQAVSQSSEFARVVLDINLSLSELLRNPFNLRLMGELLGLGVPLEELSPICRQDELLDRYWSARVVREDASSDAREAVLRKISAAMVRERSLKTSRLEMDLDHSNSAVLKDLLSSHVIAEWQSTTGAAAERYTLTFSHHVIFDYAVSRLLLRVPNKDFVNFFVKDPKLLLVIRPSIVFYFTHIWSEDLTRQAFWKLVAEVLGCKDIPEVGKLIGPGVASQLATRVDDFEPLFRMLENGSDVPNQQIAEKACNHIIGALLSIPESSVCSLVGHSAGPWAQFLLRISEAIRHSTAYIICQLLITLCEHSSQFTQEQERCIGKTARSLLTFARENSPRNPWLIKHAIQGVCRSFKSDATDSNKLIRQSLEPDYMKLHAVEEMPWLAREVKNLMRADANLVEDIYKAAFTFIENSEEQTQIGGSQIVALTSTRKQDYAMVRYILADEFPKFLEIAPFNATHALIAVVNEYVKERHSPNGEVADEVFEFDGLHAQIKADYSTIWDDGDTYRHDDPLKMLDIFGNFLIDTTGVEDLATCRREIIKIIALENKLAVIWKLLLRCGIKAPNTIGIEIKSLAWAKPILLCHDTEVAVGNLIKVIFEYITEQERELIENAILSLAEDSVPHDQIPYREEGRNRLLGCLPEQLIVTERVRLIINDLKIAEKLPSNEPKFRITTEWSNKPYGEKEYLAEKGVPVDKEASKLIRTIEQPLNDFSQEHLNLPPNIEAIQAIFPSIRNLYDALASADKDGVHPMQKDYAWGTLAEVCARVASSNELSPPEIESFVKAVLLEAAKHKDPIPQPELDSQFDEYPFWTKPAPRIDAAIGLMLLAQSPSCVDDELLETIKSLSTDEVPAVRFQVVTHLVALYQTSQDVMWEIIENVCEKEQSKGVLRGLITATFHKIAGTSADCISVLTKAVFDRVKEGLGADSVRQACVNIFGGLYIWKNINTCRDIIIEMVENPINFLKEVHQLVINTQDVLTHGPVDPIDEEQDAVRKRAFSIFEWVTNSVLIELRAIDENKFKAGVDLSPDETEVYKGLAQIIDSIGTGIYFASGAYDDLHAQQRQDKKILSMDARKRFLSEADNLLNSLSNFGMIPSLTHHLLETLEVYIPIDPINVFTKVSRIVIMAKSRGYQYESLAADLMVKIIERYLAEYSWVFREQDPCQQALLEILDIFVNAGWPSARRLSYRLEEIYR